MHISLTQLRILRAFQQASPKNFQQVADLTGLTPPFVTQQLRRLEDETGLPLFDYEGRSKVPNRNAEELIRHAEQVLTLLDRTEQVVDDLYKGVRGLVTLSASSTVGSYILPAVLAPCRDALPEVRFTVGLANRRSAQEDLRAGKVDIAIARWDDHDRTVQAERFALNQIVVIAHPSHRLAQEPQISLAQLTEHTLPLRDRTFLLREEGSGTREDMVRTLREAGIELPDVPEIELRGNAAIKQGVAAGLGITLIAYKAIEHYVALKKVEVLNVVGFPRESTWHLIRQKDRQGERTKAADNVWNFLLQESARQRLLQPQIE